MQNEIEVKFLSVNIDEIRERLSTLWAKNTKQRTLFKRIVYHSNIWDTPSFLRLRDEWDKITMTFKKIIDPKKIDWVLESEVIVSNFEETKRIIAELWIKQKAYQETYRENRELWKTCIWIDEWPWLNPFIEIEWEHEQEVIKISESLGFNFEDWVFGSVSEIYGIELWLSWEQINNMPEITFKNPPTK